MTKIMFVSVSVFFASMIMVSCLTSTKSANEQLNSLRNTRWNLIELEGQPLLDGTKITMDVHSNSIKGFSGCNTYRSSGDIIIEKGHFQIHETARTTKDCQPEILRQEVRFIELLTRARLYKVIGNRLYIYDNQGAIILVFGHK